MEIHQEDDTTPYFKIVNEELLKMANTESILQLFDVGVKTKDNVNKHHSRWSNRECSPVSCLINDAIKTSSPQVSYILSN